MVTFPNCKINIGLQVTGKRPDGYHDLQTIFYPLFIRDALEIIDDPQTSNAVFTSSGIKTGIDNNNNLCVKARQLLQKDFTQLPAYKMHLHKAIPIGAGLGGGSADAAFTLQLINTKYHLGLDTAALIKYALLLGSDCPFFIINKPCYAMGRGELLQEIPLDLSVYKILLVYPGIHVNTGWAFSVLGKVSSKIDLIELIKRPVTEWQGTICNDFETTVFSAYPEIRSIKETLLSQGALYSAMSGSGSSVYGIFEKNAAIPLNFPSHYFCKWT